MTYNLQNPSLVSSIASHYPPPTAYFSRSQGYVDENLSSQNLDNLPIRALKKQIIDLTVEKKNLESRGLRLEKEIVALRNQCEKLQQHSSRDVEKNLRNELVACKLQIERSDEELKKLERQFTQSEGRGSKRKREEIATLKNQLRIVEERQASDKSYFETTLKEEFEKRQKLGQELAEEREQLAEERERNRSLQSRISLVREELNHVFGNAQELHALIANLKEENRKLKEELEKSGLEKETPQINS